MSHSVPPVKIMKHLTNIPTPPAGYPAAVKKEFTKIATHLSRLNLIDDADTDLILNLAIQFDRRKKLLKKVQKEGEVLIGEKGVQRNPASKILDDTLASIVVISRELGFSPKARRALEKQMHKETDIDISDALNRMVS
jgi:P27 family predicted phage terminase small subunit